MRQSALLHAGWNAVGLNVTRLVEVAENPDILSVAAYQPPVGYTQGAPGLAAFTPTGRGYWVLAAAETRLVYGGVLEPENRVRVSPGWSLLAFPGGSSNPRAFVDGAEVPLASLLGLESLEIEADGSYQPVTSFAAGHAYWVYALRAGELR